MQALLLTFMLCLLTGGAFAQTDLTWDPGTSNTGTQVYTHPNNAAGQYHFKVVTEASVQGGWRTALRVTAGNANLYLRQGAMATTTEFTFSSTLAGSDGFVLDPGQYGAGQEWFILVDVPASATWSLVSGEIFVQDLGTLPFTDSNSNLVYDIGEAVTNGGPGALPVGAEGTRFFKADAPTGTPAWSLWLNGLGQDIRVRKGQAPVNSADRAQNGRLLLVPSYLDTSTVFIAVSGAPGTSINLDSRIQTVTDIAFGSTQSGVALTDAPFRVYRTTVPPEQLGWDVSVTPSSGDANVAVRRDQVAGELDNDAYSEVTGSSVDSVTLVPPGLADGTWFILVYGPGGATFSLNNSAPVPVAISFTDTKVNAQPARVGWRYFALTDIPSQLGRLGWQLELTGHVPGTEIALRRGSLPGRWNYRNGPGFPGSPAYLDYSSITGRLDRPGHQADVWYAGVYLGTEALGSFTLNTREIPAPPVVFNGGSSAISNQHHTEWRWWRVDVPNTAGLLGWELKLASVTSGNPGVVVGRGSLPASVSSAGWNNASPCEFTTWPQGYQWTQQRDFSDRETTGGNPWRWRQMVIPMGRPLEPGTYYVGVGNVEGTAPMSYTLESRGIGTGQAITVTTLGNANTPSSLGTGNVAPREHRFYKATVPAGLRSWELVLTPTLGDMTLTVRRGALPAPEYSSVDFNGGKHLTKEGKERYVLLPRNNQDFLDEGDYYIAVASEGQGPSGSDIGTGNAAGTLANNGPLVATDLGTATAGGVSVPVTLEGGQIKAFRVLAPAGLIGVEARLDSRTGLPGVSLNSGLRLPYPYNNTSYGFDYGQFDGSPNHPSLVVIPNAPAGEYRILVSSYYDGGATPYPDSTATLVITARTPPAITFNGGTSAVSGHQPNGWRFFRVDVPSGVLGWNVTLANISGVAPSEYTPSMVIRRDLLTTFIGNTHNFGNFTTAWPSGYQWTQQNDHTWRNYEQDNTRRFYSDFTAATGRPLEPGTYYACVHNPGPTPVSYTFESRGIGSGQALPVTTLAFTGGSAVTPSLPARSVAYYKVTVPASTTSWEITLEPGVGDMQLKLLHGSIPDPDGGGVLYAGGERIQKAGAERYVVLPEHGQQFLQSGDYYLAAVSEGESPPNATIGTGSSQGTLTSVGPLPVTSLGNATTVPTNTPVSLLSAQIKAFQITVPAGASSLDVVLDTHTGAPRLTGVPGSSLPRGWNFSYGYFGGQFPAGFENEFHITSPAAGVWSFLIGAGDEFFGSTYPDATGTLHVSIAAGPQPLTFDGGSASVAGHADGTWKFWEVTVPPGVAGWDLRIVNVTAGVPQMVVRRGMLPEALTTSGFPDAFNEWPVGASRSAHFTDMNHRRYDPDGRDTYGQYLMNPMGAPLEPGTYFIGVTNPWFAAVPMSYTLESRGIGNGQSIAVTNLALNGSQPVASTPARMAKYFKVTIPAGTPSWELTLPPAAGDLCMAIRRDALPDTVNSGSIYGGGGRFQQQPDSERFVLLPQEPEAFLFPGDYYIAAISEGVNPGVPSAEFIGTGDASGILTSSSPLAVTHLGAATAAGSTTPVSLASGQMKTWQFTVPAGAPGLEVRLDNRVGNPGMHVRSDGRVPETTYYASQGGGSAGSNTHVLSYVSPPAGTWSLSLDTQGTSAPPAPASADLVIRVLQPQRLNFSSTENGNGFSHTHSRAMLNGQRQFYEVQVPATLSGQPILGWWLRLDATSSSLAMRVRDVPDFTADPLATYYAEDMILSPPYFMPGHTYYVELDADDGLSYTLTSQPTALNLPAYTMTTTAGVTFADTGSGLPGDQGRDLADDAWHFYAFDVPSGNGGLLRAELAALNGNPDLFLRAGGVPTPHHDSNGPPHGGEALVHYLFNGIGTQYGNWTPVDGRTQRELTPGRWYAGVRATGGSNARYRLQLTTGSVQTLALNGGSVTGQNLAAADVRYYKFTVPLDAPNNWNLTFNETIGDVRVFVRDTIPPGDTPFIGSSSITDLSHWSTDQKNQGPYPRYDSAGTYTLTTPPLRPAHTYYVAVQAVTSAQFSFSSSTTGGTVGATTVVDFYTGVINTTLTAGQRKRYRVPVPAGALRWKHTSTHDAGVRIIIEQGTIPLESSQHYISTSADSSLNRSLVNWGWPFFANHDYYIIVANDTASTQPFVLTMDGRDATTEDEDHDGMADPWELTHFGDTFSRDGSGDFDGDGLADRVEYALGLNPTSSSSAFAPSSTITGAGPASRLALDIQHGTIPPQVRLEVFGAGELGSPGTSVGMRPPGGVWNVPATPIPGGVRIKDTQPYDTSARRFLWLEVTLVPEP